MLANVPIATVFGLGGFINSPVLRPTAGREAVTDESRTLAQHLLGAVERGLAEHIAATAGLPERFSSFYRYLAEYGYWNLAGPATIRVHGSGGRVPLSSMRGSPSGKVHFARDGHDQSIMQAYGEQHKVVVLLSSDGYRQKVERQYLAQYCSAEPLEDRVACLRVVEELSFSQTALQFQLVNRLRTQFLIDGLRVRAGELSHGAMLWTPPGRSGNKILFIDFRHPRSKDLFSFVSHCPLRQCSTSSSEILSCHIWRTRSLNCGSETLTPFFESSSRSSNTLRLTPETSVEFNSWRRSPTCLQRMSLRCSEGECPACRDRHLSITTT